MSIFNKKYDIDFLMQRKPMVELSNIHKKYENSEYNTINDLNLSIYEGEFFALLGPSGCGKTTLLRTIAGFEHPSSGSISINGFDMTDVPPFARPVNMMFQSYALFPHMTVEQNVAFGLKQDSLGEKVIKKKVEEALEMVKMSDFAKRKPNQLSGGQQQRVALARSLVKKPKLLLLDEPLGALDRKTREHTQIELINIQTMLGITFIMVTHDEEEAMSMATRIGVMNQGKLMQVGTPQNIYEYPDSRFVADFIGSINMFHGTVIAHSDDEETVIVRSHEAQTDIRVENIKTTSEGQEVWVAIRPEEFTISSSPRAEGENQIEGKIIDIAFLGNQVVYHIDLGNESDKIIHASVPTTARNLSADLQVGNVAYLSWDDDDCVLLTY